MTPGNSPIAYQLNESSASALIREARMDLTHGSNVAIPLSSAFATTLAVRRALMKA